MTIVIWDDHDLTAVRCDDHARQSFFFGVEHSAGVPAPCGVITRGKPLTGNVSRAGGK